MHQVRYYVVYQNNTVIPNDRVVPGESDYYLNIEDNNALAPICYIDWGKSIITVF